VADQRRSMSIGTLNNPSSSSLRPVMKKLALQSFIDAFTRWSIHGRPMTDTRPKLECKSMVILQSGSYRKEAEDSFRHLHIISHAYAYLRGFCVSGSINIDP
jgi:hypothetical protein